MKRVRKKIAVSVTDMQDEWEEKSKYAEEVTFLLLGLLNQ